MNKNSCYTYFVIEGIFNPDDITKILNLMPYKIVRIGDVMKNNKISKVAKWYFNKNSDYTPYINEQMRITINPLLDKIDLLNKIQKEYEASFTLEVVPSIYFNEINPSLAPSLDIIDFCHDTRTNIDIDLYLLK